MRSSSIPAVAGFVLAITTVLAGAQTRGGDPIARAVQNPVPSSPESIATGRQQYQRNCRHCHGAQGRGDGTLAPKDPSPSNLTDGQWDHGSSDGEIFAVISNGAGKDSTMKAMKATLTATNIWNIINYLRSLGAQPATPDGVTP